jgi:TPR repeat protein
MQLCQLGNLYDSQGDDNRALKCYQVAAEAFDMGGMYNYANALLLGKGCERNEKCGTAWLREAAAMVCDSDTFVKRHLPTRFYVREDGAEHKDELTIHHDDNGDATRVESSMSGSVLWDAATDSEEELQNLFRGLKLEVADSEVLNTSISSLPPPVPARASYRDAAIDVSAMLGNSDLSVIADFATGVVDVNALKNFDGSPRVLTSDELLAVALLSVSMNRGRADASQYTSDLLNSRGWARALELMHNRSAAGDGHVCAILGALYRNGLGIGEDHQMAHALFLKARPPKLPI